MKTTQKLLSAVLSLSMLLSLLSGAAYAAPGSVTVGQETAFVPLSEEASIAYEQHEDGYEVTLERAAESLTMQITAVPDSGRTAEKARLYIRTGVKLKAQTSYLVSFDLSAQKALADYTVSLDGDAEGAYGTLSGRGVAERGVDRVREFITPEAESGELVLRLLVGNTEANTLRFSNLAVEEASAEEVAAGPGKVLADKLNLSAPGSVTVWTNSDCGATLDTDGESATLTVTKAPKSGKEIWKIKLLVATGLTPEAGKTYRFRAGLRSSASQPYEFSCNDGGTEKGYDVLYNQQLAAGAQTVERLVYITRDKENPGELIFQFSLGKMSVGDKVTISGVTVEEARANYTNVLPRTFAFDKTREYTYYTKENTVLSTTTTEVPLNIQWAKEAAVWEWHEDKIYTAALSRTESSATLTTARAKNNADGSVKSEIWHSKLYIRTGATLEAGSYYQVGYSIQGAREQKYNVLFGFVTSFGTEEKTYGENYDRSISTSAKSETFAPILVGTDGELLLTFEVGQKDIATGNSITVSDVTVKKVTPTPGNEQLPESFSYNYIDHVSKAGDRAHELVADEDKVSLDYLGYGSETNPDKQAAFNAQLVIRTGITPAKDVPYIVSFKAKGDAAQNGDISILYGAPNNEDCFARLDGQSLSTDYTTYTRGFVAQEVKGELVIRLQVGKTPANNTITVTNLQIHTLSDSSEANKAVTMTYPTSALNTDVVTVAKDNGYDIALTPSGDGKTLDVNVYGVPTEAGKQNKWDAKVFIHTGVTLEPNIQYTVSVDVAGTVEGIADNTGEYDLKYNSGSTEYGYKNADNEDKKGASWNHFQEAGETVTHPIYCETDSAELVLQFDIGGAQTRHFTISNIKIEQKDNLINFASCTVAGRDDSSAQKTFDSDGKTLIIAHDTAPHMTEIWFTADRALKQNKHYTVQTQIWSNQTLLEKSGENERDSFNILYSWAGGWDPKYHKASDDAGNPSQYGVGIVANTPTWYPAAPQKIYVNENPGGNFKLMVQLGRTHVDGAGDTQVRVEGLKIYEVTATGDKNLYEKSFVGTASGGTGDFSSGTADSCAVQLFGTNSPDTASLNITTAATSPEAWKAKLFADTKITMTAGKSYVVKYDIKSNRECSYETCFNSSEEEKGLGAKYGLTATGTSQEVTYVGYANTNCNGKNLKLQFNLGKASAGTTVTVSNIQVTECSYATDTDLFAGAPYQFGTSSSFSVDGAKGDENHSGAYTVTMSNFGASETVSITQPVAWHDDWGAKLFIDTGVTLTEGTDYQISMKVAGASGDYKLVSSSVAKNDLADNLIAPTQTLATSATAQSVIITAGKTKPLYLQLNLGNLSGNVNISEVSVKEITYTTGGNLLARKFNEGSVSFSSFEGSDEDHNRYWAYPKRNADSAEIDITHAPTEGKADWKVKMEIDTGFTPRPDQGYRVSFRINGTEEQKKFHIFYGYGDGSTEKIYGDKYEVPITTGMTEVTHDIFTNDGTGALRITLLLGLTDGTRNKITVSDVKIYQNSVRTYAPSGGVTGTADYDAQPGYRLEIAREAKSATLSLLESPATGAEAWKTKFFIDTGVNVDENESFRVCLDVMAEKDAGYEICYNRDSSEAALGALYDLRAAGGKVSTVEKIVTAQRSGKLIIQLSLGRVAAPNAFTVSNVRVERVSYSYSGGSALPTPISYRAQSAVSAFVHEDYTANLSGAEDAITLNLLKAPARNPEPWKIKLFINTAVVLEPGKNYRVSANVRAKSAQSFEVCYNNGGAEGGYGTINGLRLEAGKAQTVDKLISVPEDLRGTANLELQFNLGRASGPNEITVSDVLVEEVTPSYVDVMKGFSYQKALSTWTDPKTSYQMSIEGSERSAKVRVTNAPASGAGVWMAKIFVHTGAILEAGKTYLVHTDLAAELPQDYEVCFNNEETEKGFDALYGQKLPSGKASVDRTISVPVSMTDAGELVLQFSVGASIANEFRVSGVSVKELTFGAGGVKKAAPDTVIDLQQAKDASGTLDVTHEKLAYHMANAVDDGNTVAIAGASLRGGEQYAVTFRAKADKEMTGTLLLRQAGRSSVLSETFKLSPTEQAYTFTTPERLSAGGAYDILWQFGSAENQALGSADVELSNISVYIPSERLEVMRSGQRVTVNGTEVKPDIYNINGNNYFKLRDLAVLLTDTDGQFVVRYNGNTGLVSLTTGKEYTPVGGELTVGADLSATCVRSPQHVAVNGSTVDLKAYNIGGNNFFKLRDLSGVLGYKVDYIPETNTAAITSPLTPEAQEKAHAYDLFFLPEIDGESQPYVGDTMPFYDDGTYYIYYLKEGGDSYNHSVYMTSTKDFVSYTEGEAPVLEASRSDVQDSWIGTGSVVKAEDSYYFFYTGFNASGSHEYHEKIMVAKGDSPTSFTKVTGWEITPPAELHQKNDFRDPQAYYDPNTGTFSLTVTASQDGRARILKYTLDKDLRNARYDGVIFTDPTGDFYNLECSDTFQIGDKWYLTYSGQEDTVWYAMSDSRFGPYTNATRLEGKLFYAAKHVENDGNSYMVGWAKRSDSASSTDEVSGWGGNVAVQKLVQHSDGSLSLVPVEQIAEAFNKEVSPNASTVSVSAASGKSYQEAFTSTESFMLSGEFTYSGSGSFGLAFDFNDTPEQYKLISLNPAGNTLSLAFQEGNVPITETAAKLSANEKHTFTYIQDGSVGTFYLDGQSSLTVRLYGSTDKPIRLFAENNSVTFTSLRQFTR